jgi:hypothetical protein
MILPVNTYLFLYEDYPWKFIETKDQFMDECTRVFNNARNKFPNSQFMFVAQGFYDENKYRKPPIESVDWTNEFVANNDDVIGVLWYEYKDRSGTGLGSMPMMLDRIKDEK